jgi:hypothetical protein
MVMVMMRDGDAADDNDDNDGFRVMVINRRRECKSSGK